MGFPHQISLMTKKNLTLLLLCLKFDFSGKLILVKIVLENILVFWLTLAKIHVSILDDIRRKTFNFLWAGNKEKFSYHLVNWKVLSQPKVCGGWGLKHNLTLGEPCLQNLYGGVCLDRECGMRSY